MKAFYAELVEVKASLVKLTKKLGSVCNSSIQDARYLKRLKMLFLQHVFKSVKSLRCIP